MTSKKVVDCLKNNQYYLRIEHSYIYIYLKAHIFGKSPFVIEINRRTKWAIYSVANSKLQTLLNHQLLLLKTQFSMAYSVMSMFHGQDFPPWRSEDVLIQGRQCEQIGVS